MLHMVPTSNFAFILIAPRLHIPHALTPLRTTTGTTNATGLAEAARPANAAQGALAGRRRIRNRSRRIEV